MKQNETNQISVHSFLLFLIANLFLMFVLASYSLPSIVVAIRKTWASWHLLGRLLLKHGCPCRLSSSCLGVGVSAGSWREGWSWWMFSLLVGRFLTCARLVRWSLVCAWWSHGSWVRWPCMREAWFSDQVASSRWGCRGAVPAVDGGARGLASRLGLEGCWLACYLLVRGAA